MSSTLLITKTPFELEKLRADLATRHKYSSLRKMYKKSYKEIKDLNSPGFWDNLNQTSTILKTQNPIAWNRLNHVARLIPDSSKSVLDIGFGSASLEDIVFESKNKKDYNWFGIDISPKSVKYASQKYPFAKFNIGSIDKLNFKLNSFDCVIVLEVLEHISPSKTFSALSETKRVLKSKGYLIVSVPLNEGLKDMIKVGKNPNAHVRIYTPDLIKAELKITGFEIIKTKKLYAFHTHNQLKSLLSDFLNLVGIRVRLPNNIILIARKI